jgi:hypothetical protein
MLLLSINGFNAKEIEWTFLWIIPSIYLVVSLLVKKKNYFFRALPLIYIVLFLFWKDLFYHLEDGVYRNFFYILFAPIAFTYILRTTKSEAVYLTLLVISVLINLLYMTFFFGMARNWIK